VQVVDEDVLTAECGALVDRYMSLNSSQLSQSVVLAQCIQQIVQRGAQRLDDSRVSRSSMWDNLLCCALVGSHDSDVECKTVWEGTLDAALTASGAGTKVSAILRTLPLVLDAVRRMCLELSWLRRAQAVRLLRDVIGCVPAGSLIAGLRTHDAQVTALLQSLLQLIPGPIWGEQASVLEAVSELMSKCHTFVEFGCAPTGADLANLPVCQSGAGTKIVVADLCGGGLLNNIVSSMAMPSSNSITNTPYLDLSTGPKLHFQGWVVVLVHESRRGAKTDSNVAETEYRIAAARALSLLPWQHLCASTDGVDTLHSLLPVLCKQAGIPPYGVLPSASPAAADTGNADAAAKQEGSRRNKRTLGNDALFGVRYDTKQAKDVSTAAKSNRSSSTPTAQVEDALQALAPAAATDEPMAVEAEDASDAQTHRTDPAGEEVPGNETGEVAMAVDASTSSYVEFTHKHPPVYYLSYLESLCRAWPKLDAEPPSSHLRDTFVECAEHILAWAEIIMRAEVWSVRRAAVQLLGVVTVAGHLATPNAPRLLGIVELAMGEQKYAKLRVEALRTLALILQSPLRVVVSEDTVLTERVRSVIRTASTDSQPTILEAVSKVQNVWFA
jgi:hypothetical protein